MLAAAPSPALLSATHLLTTQTAHQAVSISLPCRCPPVHCVSCLQGWVQHSGLEPPAQLHLCTSSC